MTAETAETCTPRVTTEDDGTVVAICAHGWISTTAGELDLCVRLVHSTPGFMTMQRTVPPFPMRLADPVPPLWAQRGLPPPPFPVSKVEKAEQAPKPRRADPYEPIRRGAAAAPALVALLAIAFVVALIALAVIVVVTR